MTGIKFQTAEHPALSDLLSNGGVRKERWEPIKGMEWTSLAPFDTREGQAHILKVGDMWLALIAPASGRCLYLDLNAVGEGLPRKNSGQGVRANNFPKREGTQASYRAEMCDSPEGFVAQLYWWENGDHTVRLLIAENVAAVVECRKASTYSGDQTPGKLTLSSQEGYEQVRRTFPGEIPLNVEVRKDPRLAHFTCANADTLCVSGVFRTQ
ncbi:hypothetical protein KSX_63300 [Ktedonospora formicarum]|uniref:Uncharacterized protein n=1 Tax=Ktedonospora formicarum TaxID=2778364 RepID=A0A8J3I196_9CHLR|nr:hypothetical protein KSX_63300 [Ktedonospora formicarum]